MKSSEIRTALQNRYCAPEWCLMHEVANGTGYAQKRYADCIAMNLFPSRGLAIHGIEIKVSRGDLLSELKQPEKADEIARYCDFWYVAAPKDLCRPDELPMTWGLLEVDEGGGVREKKKPLKLEAKPLDRSFVAAMARRINQLDAETINRKAEESIAGERKRLQEKADELREERNKYPHGLLERYKELIAMVQAFEASVGFKLVDGWRGYEDLCKAAEAVRRIGITNTYGRITALRNTLRADLKTIEETLSAFDPPRIEENEV